MAPDQRRKRLNGASIVGCSPMEPHRIKRKNIGVMRTDMNMKSHISVEWDCHQKTVIAKREQIGISWRNMSPFVIYPHHDHNVLADAFSVPTEIFELDGLRDVLSYETWQMYLTENERNHLSQFLPRGLELDQVVQELLNGNNFHFGNSFLKWSDSVCSGDFHPDAILLQEQCSKSNKKLHYSELRRYHNDMIKFLIEMRERWESCKDPEKDIVQKLWRSRNEEKRISSHLNESRLFDPEEDVSSTSESGSWATDERACSSDNQILSLTKSEKLKKRILEKETARSKSRSSLFSSDDTLNLVSRSMKGDNVHKRNITCDGAKYLSYIKVTKRQLELVKSMKKAGQSIQAKSLDCILGNLDSLHVQPYEVFVEEEQKNLRDHWSHLVNKDVPSAYTFWRERQTQIERMKNSMEEEMLHKLKPLMEDEKNVSSGSDDLQDPDVDEEINEETSEGEDEVGSGPDSLENQSPGEISSPSSGDDFTPISSNPEKKNNTPRSEDPELTNTKCSNNLYGSEIPVSIEVPVPSEDTVWQSAGTPHSYYDATLHHDYSPAALSNVNPQINEEQQSQLIDVETDLCEEESDKELLHGHSADGPFCSYVDRERNDIFQSHHKQKDILQSRHEQMQTLQSHREENTLRYHRELSNSCEPHEGWNGLQSHQDHSHFLHSHQNQHDLVQTQQDQNDLLHSLCKGPGLFPRHDQRGSGLNFLTHNDVTMEDGHFTGHFKEALQPSLTLDWGQKRPIYLGKQMSDNVHTDGSRYLLPGQGNLSSVNMPDWAVTAVRMSTPSQSQLGRAEYLGQHLFLADEVRGGWTGSDGSSLPCQSIGNGASSDQGLYSVFSHYSDLRSSTNPVRPADQLMTSRTSASCSLVHTMPPRIDPVIPQTSLPLNFLNVLDAATSVVPNEMARKSLPPQSPALHDRMGKTFLRSWNR